jgi:hypothetical protein
MLREAGIENVERILEMGEEKLLEIPGIGDKTAAKIMEAARDLFEEVEIEVPEGMEIPTAIQGPGARQAEKPATAPAEAESTGEEAGQPQPETVEDTTPTEAVGDGSAEGGDQGAASEDQSDKPAAD